MEFVKRLAANTKGRDLIVGDVHGHFTKLRAALEAAGFNPDAGDRLISVGDLVDRGPESDEVLDWLGQPWFHAVAGNHEDMAVLWAEGSLDSRTYVANGGAWNVSNPRDHSVILASVFAHLPIAIELETDLGLVGIVHADCPLPTWSAFTGALRAMGEVLAAGGELDMEAQGLIANAMWSRDRFDSDFGGGVEGVRAVIVGHTPMEAISSLGNVIYADTGAWLRQNADKPLTLIDAADLAPAYRPLSLAS